MLGKCAVCLCLHLSLSLSPCVFFCLLKIQTAASWICIYIPTSQRPDHWSLLSRGRRASPGFWYSICSQFHPLCSSTIVLLPKVFPFISSWVFFFPFRFNSPQSSNYCFLHFFPSVHFRLKSNPLRSTASFFSTSSFHPHFSHSSLFSRLLSIHPPFHIHPLSRGFHSITTNFTSFATSSPSPPSVEQMKNTTLKRPFPPMFSACLLQNSRAS